jgi:hypothetical protein
MIVKPNSIDPSAIVIPFGKHKGKTVAELLTVDPGYADWVTSQGWVAERFAELHAAIINRGAGTDDTPEHNALQARFLDEAFRESTIKLAQEEKLQDELDDTKRHLIYDAKYEIDLFANPRYHWETISQERLDEAHAAMKDISEKNMALQTKVSFEISGVDVLVEFYWTSPRTNRRGKSGYVRIELKPAIGDDYPTVIRQMRRLGATVLVASQYTGRGVSEMQLCQMFEASGLTVVFVQEIEENMRVRRISGAQNHAVAPPLA